MPRAPLLTKAEIARMADLYAQGRSASEIAAAMDIKVGTVQSRIWQRQQAGDPRFPARMRGVKPWSGSAPKHAQLPHLADEQRAVLAAAAAARRTTATRLVADLLAILLDDPTLLDNVIDDGVQTPGVGA